MFQYKDHLGNVRITYTKNAQNVLEIIDENHYYPFGLKHEGYITLQGTNNKYKYNGKELQDEMGLGMYDYGFRNYDPALVRWMNIDPLAEFSRRWSPYTYCYNNPVFFIDPDGMLATYDWDAHNSGRKGVYKDGNKEVSFGEAMASHGINGNKSSTPKQEQYKNGDYVAVVNAPKGAGGFGHNALLVGNDDAGWVFISKEGRDADENSNSGNNPLTGGSALDARKESFATINAFFADRDYSEYKEGVVIKIQSSTAEKGEKEMTK